MLVSILTSFYRIWISLPVPTEELTTCVDCISQPFSPPYSCRILTAVQWVAGWCHIALWQMLSLVPLFCWDFYWFLPRRSDIYKVHEQPIHDLYRCSVNYPKHIQVISQTHHLLFIKISKNIKLFKVLLCKKQTGLKATHPSPSIPQNTQTHM